MAEASASDASQEPPLESVVRHFRQDDAMTLSARDPQRRPVDGCARQERAATELPGSTGWVLAAACVGTFMAILDTSLVNLGLHAIQQDLHADMAMRNCSPGGPLSS